jgi:hypothetical protein
MSISSSGSGERIRGREPLAGETRQWSQKIFAKLIVQLGSVTESSKDISAAFDILCRWM